MKGKKRKVLLVLLLLVLVAGWFVGGYLLPGDWTVERSVVVSADREAVYAEISSPRAWAEWTVWNAADDPGLRVQFEGPEAGLGAFASFVGGALGAGSVDVVEADPETGVAYRLRPQAGQDVTGALRMEDVADGVRVTWTASGDFKTEMGRKWAVAVGLVQRSVGADLEASLEGLEARLER